MRTLLALIFMSLHWLVSAQIAFEELPRPDDFSIGTVRKSPGGEYFMQPWNATDNMYTSMNGVDWTKTTLPTRHKLFDIQFLTDDTPLVITEYDRPLVRRDGNWYTMDMPGDHVFDTEAAFVKDDTLFGYHNLTFSYSLDKGNTFTVLFVTTEDIIDHSAHLWKFEHHFVLHHTAGASDHLSVFNESGERVFYQELNLSTHTITYNACGQVLFTDRDTYYLLREQGLTLSYGNAAVVHPDFDSNTDILSQNGNYYLRNDDIIYKSSGCSFTWEVISTDDLISSKEGFWVNHNEDILLYGRRDDFFLEQLSGAQSWEERTPDILYPYITAIDESTSALQFAMTANNMFGKTLDDPTWTEWNTAATAGFQMQYSPDGDLYANGSEAILYSKDNGQNFTTIALPEGAQPFGGFYMYILDDDFIFIVYDLIGDSYYTLNNGQDWVSAGAFFTLYGPKVKLVDNYILMAEVEYGGVAKINLGTNEMQTVELGNFFTWNYDGTTILDDGTLYFYAADLNAGLQEALYRYRFGGQVEFVGDFPGLQNMYGLFASGSELYAFGSNEYRLFNGTSFETKGYTGLPSGSKYFTVSENEHLYVIVDATRIFRSTRPLSFPGVISGSLFHHKNQNCISDTTEARLAHWQIKVDGEDYMRVRATGPDGRFRFSVPDGEYTLSAQPVSDHWELCANDFNIILNDANPFVKQDFLAKAVTHCAELELDFSTPFLRRCFENYYSVRVRNTGPEATLGTTLDLELDPFFEFISATIPYTQIDAHTVQFDLGVLDVNEEVTFRIYFTVSCDAELGSEHCMSGNLIDQNKCAGDRSYFVECQTNIGSLDPNDKRIFNEDGKEAERVDKGEYIYYHIRFQNTGTDTAFTVRITDPLSSMLDLSTLEMLSASHPYTYSITDGPSLVALFENILLPDSTENEASSHGFLKFRIKPFVAFDYGTAIPNRADIYFDFNDPVLTNEVILVILPTVAIKEAVSFVDFTVYPNPSEHLLSIAISEDDRNRVDTYEILDQQGRLIIHSRFLQEQSHFDVKSLVPGAYTLVLKQEGETIGRRKFVKM